MVWASRGGPTDTCVDVATTYLRGPPVDAVTLQAGRRRSTLAALIRARGAANRGCAAADSIPEHHRAIRSAAFPTARSLLLQRSSTQIFRRRAGPAASPSAAVGPPLRVVTQNGDFALSSPDRDVSDSRNLKMSVAAAGVGRRAGAEPRRSAAPDRRPTCRRAKPLPVFLPSGQSARSARRKAQPTLNRRGLC